MRKQCRQGFEPIENRKEKNSYVSRVSSFRGVADENDGVGGVPDSVGRGIIRADGHEATREHRNLGPLVRTNALNLNGMGRRGETSRESDLSGRWATNACGDARTAAGSLEPRRTNGGTAG